MRPRHRCFRSPTMRADLRLHHPSHAVLEDLGPGGPLHPHLTPLRNADDACDALDLSRPDGFGDGVVLLLLDASVRPYLAIAIDQAPPDQIDHLAALLGGARDLGHPIAGVVLGVFRPTRTVGSAGSSMTIDGLQLAAWISLSRLLNELAITLVDVLVLEPGCWMSLIAEASGDAYPLGPLPWPAELH